MDKFLSLDSEERSNLFIEVAARTGISDVSAEKDFWVCYCLDYLFNRYKGKDYLIFKGGTSLSKAYRLVCRFSEDIDIILDPKALGADLELPSLHDARNQKEKRRKIIEEKTSAFLTDKFLPAFNAEVAAPLGARPAELKDGVIDFHYPAVFPGGYIRNTVKLEISPLASWLPFEERQIASYVAEKFPDLFERESFKVRVTNAEFTFWEKILILHGIASSDKMPLARMSRHYYDLFMMAENSELKEKAFSHPEFLMQSRDFSQTFYPSNSAGYATAEIGQLQLIPDAEKLSALEEDCYAMREMFFEKPPVFAEIIDSLGQLEGEINGKF